MYELYIPICFNVQIICIKLTKHLFFFLTRILIYIHEYIHINTYICKYLHVHSLKQCIYNPIQETISLWGNKRNKYTYIGYIYSAYIHCQYKRTCTRTKTCIFTHEKLLRYEVLKETLYQIWLLYILKIALENDDS